MGESASSGGGTTEGGTTGTTGSPPPDVPERCHPEDYGECDPWCQDCPEGEKCVPGSPGASSEWGPTHCVKVAADASQTGDPCDVHVASDPSNGGGDDCDAASACVTGEVEPTFTCEAFCRGSPDAPDCTFVHPLSVCRLEGPLDRLPTCTQPCSPDVPTVPGRPKCPWDPYFGCTVVPATPDEWALAERIETLPVGGGRTMRCTSLTLDTSDAPGGPCLAGTGLRCGRGLVCLASALVPYCADPTAAPGCCAPYCDLTNPDCPAGSVCRPVFEPLPEYADYANLGVCAAP